MKIILLLLSFILLSPKITAQVDEYTGKTLISATTIYTTNEKDYTGSPLLKESFKNGIFTFKNGTRSKIVPINYDSHKNQVLFIEDDQIKVLNTTNIAGFQFIINKPNEINEQFAYAIKIKGADIPANVPLQVLYNGKVKLLIYHHTHLLKGNSRDPYTGHITDRYFTKEDYYLVKPDGTFKNTKLNLKNIVRDLEKSYRKELNTYIRKNSLSRKSTSDVIELLSFYDTLLK